MKIIKYALLSGLMIVLIAAIGFVIWAKTPLGPMPEALAALETDAVVEVNQDDWIVFEPVGEQPTTGLILYPGGRVDPRSYAPAARALAAQGYRVVIVPMPLNLAVFAPNAANEVIQAYPEIQTWAIGGHSLGGAMAAGYVSNNPETVDGLVFWAAYPANNVDISQSGAETVSIYGSADTLADEATVLSAQPRLPAGTQWVRIEGGNHSQFGWFGNQPGDGIATISREAQQEQIIQATKDLLEGLE